MLILDEVQIRSVVVNQTGEYNTKNMRNLKLYYLVTALIIIVGSTQAQNFSQEYKDLQRELGKGWNTWSYGSMLTHVLLPEHLMVRLNFRQSFIGTTRDPDLKLDNLVWDTTGLVQPIAHTYDGDYTELRINDWKGNTIRVQSTTVDGELVLLVTPEERSEVRFQLEVEVGLLWGKEGTIRKSGALINARVDGKQHVVRTTSVPITAYHPYAMPYLTLAGDTRTAIYTGEERSLATLEKLISAAEDRYHSAAESYGELAEAYEGIQTVIGWNTIYDPENKRVITPVSRGWNEAWQGYVLFEWDTYLTAFICALDNRNLAYANAFAVTKFPNDNGNIGHYQMADGTVANMSQPPIGSMICRMIYEKYGEKWFVEEVFPELVRWNEWWMDNRLAEGYLRWGGWPGATPQIAAWESGLDNAPMYDGLTMLTTDNASLQQLADVGLNSLYTADCQNLAALAGVLGETTTRERLLERAERFAEQTASLWSEEENSYLNRLLPGKEFSLRHSPTLFYPMIAAVPTEEQARRQIASYYYVPEKYFGDNILPTVPRDDPDYDNIYWRGAIWPPLNFLTYLGFRKYEQVAAADLANKSFRLFEDAWKKDRRVYENINSALGVARPQDQLMADHFYTWGGLMGIMKFMEAGYYAPSKSEQR